ncbi:MAG TPA: Do family serine endopeptidase [Terriglobales bacterium]|nr:Do family serine endopeptidase [Terriglobales bacterium]
MTTWKNLTRRFLAPLLAAAMVVSFGAYEFAKPANAAAGTPAPAAAALDSNSVSALLSLDQAMEALASRVTPAIVNVTVTSKTNLKTDADEEGAPDMQQFGPFGNPFGGQFGMRQQPRVEHGLGSGVIISPDGYIVTNNHVVDGATDVSVTMSDRRILPAKVVGTDALTDLAVIKVNATDLPSVPWGDSTKLHPGQTVLAFGNPFGFRFTVTRGIVSALNRPNPSQTDRRKPGQFIQTDAAINPGNSGGPLVNARGEVIGINTFLISPSGTFSGMGFAIPTQIVRPTVDNLIKFGKVSHGYMGIGIADVTPENSRFFNLKKAEGALVTQVEPNSPGANAGLKTGDVITQLDGQPVSDAGELQVQVGQKRPGTTIKLDVIREGKNVTVPVTLEAMGKRDSDEESASSEHGKPRWGLGLADVTPDAREQLQVPKELSGAVVGNVQAGSPADNAGIQRGDVILEVNRKAVKSASDAVEQLAKIEKGQDALVLVWSNGGNTYRVLHPSQG